MLMLSALMFRLPVTLRLLPWCLVLCELDSAKDINIKAGYNGSLNESYHKTSSFSLGGLVGIGSLYTSTEDLEGRIKKTAVNSTRC
jgi:hypothetical protein